MGGCGGAGWFVTPPPLRGRPLVRCKYRVSGDAASVMLCILGQREKGESVRPLRASTLTSR